MARQGAMALAAGVLALLSPAAAIAAGPNERELGDSRVVAELPPRPGYPEGIAVNGHTVYVATLARFGTAFQGPPEVQAFDVRDGELLERYVVPDVDPARDHGLSGLAFDSDDRLYVLDTQRGIVRLDPATGEQEEYAPPFPDLPPCPFGSPCAPTIGDKPPLPNDIAFDAAGNAYVSDSLQATIWRVPPGGGAPQVWFQDARLDGGFGTNGLRLTPDREHLAVAVTADNSARGMVYRLRLGESPTAADLQPFHVYSGGEGPDNLAFGESGRLYVALAVTNQVSVLGPDGEEQARFSGPAQGDDLPVPYDMPSGVAFDDRTGSLLVNNHSEVLGLPRHFVVFDVHVADRADPLERPALP